MSITFRSVGDIISVCIIIKDLVHTLDVSFGSLAGCHPLIKELRILERNLLEVKSVADNHGGQATLGLEAFFIEVDRCNEVVNTFSTLVRNYESGLKVRGRMEERNAILTFRAQIVAINTSLRTLFATSKRFGKSAGALQQDTRGHTSPSVADALVPAPPFSEGSSSCSRTPGSRFWSDSVGVDSTKLTSVSSHRTVTSAKAWDVEAQAEMNDIGIGVIAPHMTSDLHDVAGSSSIGGSFVPELEQTEDDNYSDAGSVGPQETLYANVLQNELSQDLDPVEVSFLPELMGEFAVRLGHSGNSKAHRDMMYIAHKKQKQISKKTRAWQTDTFDDDDSGDDSSENNVSENHTSSGGTCLHEKDSNLAPYYSAERIMSWRTDQGVQHLDEQDPTFVSDHRDEDLGIGHKALRESDAYIWLVSTAKRKAMSRSQASPVEIEKHRTWLFELLDLGLTSEQMTLIQRVSRHRRPALYSATFEIDWNIVTFLEHQRYADSGLEHFVGRAITLTGDTTVAQALSCQEYMEQIWSTGTEFVQFLEDLVRSSELKHQHTFPDGTAVKVELQGGTTTILSVHGTKYGIAEIIEQILWVSTALRHSGNEPGVSLNFAKLEGNFSPSPEALAVTRVSMPSALHVGTAYCRVAYRSIPVRETEEPSPGQCWHKMFRRCSIVAGYPIRSRPLDMGGLDIPFDMMAGLVRAERVVPFCGNLVVKGLSTLLFLTRHEESCMYWHLIYNEDGSYISYADQRVHLPREAESHLAMVHPEEVNNARHFVGWTDKITDITGNPEAPYNVKGSALPSPPRSFVLEKLQINAGQFITIGTTWATSHVEKPVHVANEDDYLGRLRYLGGTWVILHDITDRTAWLVDGLSALLHLIRAHLHEEFNSEYTFNKFFTPESLEPRTEGRVSKNGVAFSTLIDEKNRTVRIYHKGGTVHSAKDASARPDEEFYLLEDAIKQVMHILELIIAHQGDERTQHSTGLKIQTLPGQQLVGYDFYDIATKARDIWPLTTTLGDDSEGWVGLTRAIHAPTLFGRGFGELMKPSNLPEQAQSYCNDCHWNIRVPPHRDLLAMSASNLSRITQLRGEKKGTDWRIVDDLHITISQELFQKCARKGRCHTTRIQSIRRRPYDGSENLIEEGYNKNKTLKKKKVGVWRRLISSNPKKMESTSETGFTSTTAHNLEGGILLGIEPGRLKKETPQTRKINKSWTPPDIRVVPSVQSSQSDGVTPILPLQVTASQSTSRGSTSQDRSTASHPCSGQSSMTEPSQLLSPTPISIEGASSGGRRSIKARSTTGSKGKAPMRTWV
ncbi:hypothetical protein K491DRAFT_695417 [Lophiostoma macrostomum CBS 122681]|uniref:Fungal N-terminal domain-containing protein n=1 Tax=Lophiostoma macrostomum CBS 122681 TaxID=1314788 RepID=A0A6A6SZY2_9PLEO|nr:hypothetical protein K491DRAFT_695417 [Lophiostoma macrostomum CBS 122681]